MRPIELVLSKLTDAAKAGDGWESRCPAHDDGRASLSIGQGRDGRALLHCHAGCETSDIVASLGLTMRDLMTSEPPKPKRASGKHYPTPQAALAALERKRGKHTHRWVYQDAAGEVVGGVFRWDLPDGKKDIRPISRNGKGWKLAGMTAPRPLYQLPTLADASRVYVCEGEKAADAGRKIGLTATTSPHGASSASKADWTPLAGKDVIILPDHDKPGEAYAAEVAALLQALVPPSKVRIVRLAEIEPRLPEGGDLADLLDLWDAQNLDDIRAAVVAAVASAPECEPPKPVSGGCSILSPEGRTEAANARRLAAAHGVNLRWCHQWGKWLVWDGARWAPDRECSAEHLAKQTAATLWGDVAATKGRIDQGMHAELVRFARASNQATGLRNSLTLARSEPGIPITPEQLDRDIWSLNVKNGTLDLRTGELRPHDRADLLTKMAPVAFDSAADCPLWLDFLRTVTGGNTELQEFLRRLVGYCLTGSVQDHVLPFLYGLGANGKSVFLNTVLALLGPDYGMKAPPDLLMAKKGQSHPTERADLFGRRFVAAIEAEDGRRLAEALVKELSGGDVVRARRMREDFWEFEPTHKIWLAANHKPTIRGADNGIWRRVKLVPFTVTIPPERQDKSLPDKLRQELPGILNWALFGCLEWQQAGLGEPEAVTQATECYRDEMDVLGDFLASCCIVSPTVAAGASALYAAFVGWCESNGERPIKQREFGIRLTERGFTTKRGTGGHKVRLGIGLLSERSEP